MTRMRLLGVALASAAMVCGSHIADARQRDDASGSGFKACISWCKAHNRTDNSVTKCYLGCGDYWIQAAPMSKAP
jgi:hypothetical protein